MKKKINRLNNKSSKENRIFRSLIAKYKKAPFPENEVFENLFMFLQKKDLSHLIFMNEIYKKIIGIHGNILEFGTRWGRNASLFLTLRGIHEPYNHTRKVIAFDTFSGFPNLSKKDGKHTSVKKGAYKVTNKYEEYLDSILELKELELPINHIKKYQIVRGDVSKTSHKYFKDNPEALVALAYFDLDLYKPTKEALKAIFPRLSKGSIIVFDELNHAAYPGETQAFIELFSKNKTFKLKRIPYSAAKSFLVID